MVYGLLTVGCSGAVRPAGACPSESERALPCALRRLRFSRSFAANLCSRCAACSVLLMMGLTWWDAIGLVGRCVSISVFWPCVEIGPMALDPRVANGIPAPHLGCRSSVVEHSLGKGEADSSILSGSTSFLNKNNGLTLWLRARPLGFNASTRVTRPFPIHIFQGLSG